MKILIALIVIFVGALILNKMDEALGTVMKEKGMARHIHRLAHLFYGGMIAMLSTYLRA